MSDLAEFLLARIAEDEAAAREQGDSVERHAKAQRQLATVLSYRTGIRFGDALRLAAEQLLDVDLGTAPVRVLAECDAKRRIVEMHSRNKQIRWGDYCDGCSEECLHCEGDHPWPCTNLRLLALPYAEHPDWREEWRS